jgi:non-ribosomal peptide synthetase component E (peptide arylation enzyme)
MKSTFFASLLGVAGFVGMASTSHAQTYVYDPVNQQFVLQGSTSTGYYQSAQPNIVQATAQQLLPQYFGSTTYQGSYPYSSGYYNNNSYYNNGYNNTGYYNNGRYNTSSYYSSPYGYSNTGVYSSPYGTGMSGSYRGGRGWRR